MAKLPTDAEIYQDYLARKRARQGVESGAGPSVPFGRFLPNAEAIQEKQNYILNTPMGRAESDWNRYYAEDVKKLGESMEREALSAFQREQARMKQQLGYARSAGAGTAGGWQSADIALRRAGVGEMMRISGESERFATQAKLAYLNREDTQQFQLDMMHQQYLYNKQLAEMNSDSWWGGLGKLIGFTAALPMAGGASVGGYLLGQATGYTPPKKWD